VTEELRSTQEPMGTFSSLPQAAACRPQVLCAGAYIRVRETERESVCVFSVAIITMVGQGR
jgi:hypothetical protein